MKPLEKLDKAYVTSDKYEQICAVGNRKRTKQIINALNRISDKEIRIRISELTAEEAAFLEKQAFIMGYRYAMRKGRVTND